MNFRQQQFRQSIQQQHYLDVAKNQPTIIKSTPVIEEEVNPQPIAEVEPPAPVIEPQPQPEPEPIIVEQPKVEQQTTNKLPRLK